MDQIYGFPSIHLPLSWLTALATSDVRLAVYALRALYGVTRFLHLVGMATFVGLVVLIDLRGLGLVPAEALQAARGRLGLVLSLAFWLTMATGALLFLRDPVGVGLHTMFLPKLLLIVVGYGHARLRRLPLLRRVAGLRRLGAGFSLVVWLLVIGASTWNHVERPARPGEALRLGNTGK